MSDETADSGPAAGGESSGDVESTAGAVRPADAGPETDAGVDDSVVVLIGGLGGVVVGLVCAAVALLVTGSLWAVGVGAPAWALATAYLARRANVRDAVSKTGYVIASVLLLIPAVALSPATAVDGGVRGRGTDTAVLFLFVAVPIVLAVGIGWLASRYGSVNGPARAR